MSHGSIGNDFLYFDSNRLSLKHADNYRQSPYTIHLTHDQGK